MLHKQKGYRTVALNILIALVLSLVINFSYLVMVILWGGENRSNRSQRADTVVMVRIDSAALSVIGSDSAKGEAKFRRLQQTGRSERDDQLEPIPPEGPMVVRPQQRNDTVEVALRESAIKRDNNRRSHDPWNSDNGRLLMKLEILYYFFISFILLSLMTYNLHVRVNKRGVYALRVLLAAAVAVAFYMLAPYLTWHGELKMTFQSNRLFQPMLILKVSLVWVVAILYGKIYELIFQKQSIVLENEVLKNENLVSQYNMLVNQINPHFFFNSLNSLAMLVRENRRTDALTYIDRMSDTFRYIIQDGKNSLTTLESELRFLESYKYLFEVRYQGKLFIDIDVDSSLYSCHLPSLSLQPLIENAVKHNSITKNRPLHISITAKDDMLLVSNPIIPKIDESELCTGTGLKNLSSRYKLLIKRDIEIVNDGKTFVVKLPLTN